ncbi:MULTISPECIES: Gfo/Idh/MocA family oxidoreductase [unclassified Pseudovibrio]|uniref:Gfo/Idh/MocA family protein n=1 Tax=unclassified Pseudovibrio TaxID=2627060 RepID=UPI0007AE9F40|nr:MULTISPECIES: Gfo/Idh/MocA family oxidoreductase [unclassified Pseudovibrio]KZL02380.1 putative UDP-kanosamine synthase oxidoreductase subunit [Pseudovibrio sp. W74]KZL08076.1 putative UDP-kanosamine synthase oxidoreductase subunit [Pseudovibrio sp. Ad14]
MSLSVGIIGLGEVAQLMHLPLLADDARFTISAISDVSNELMEYIGDRYGVAKRYAAASDLIADRSLDAIFILTPDHLHADLLSEAMKAGRHVFIEKPVCLNKHQIPPLLEEQKSSNSVVFVGYMRRYSRSFLALKDRMPDLANIRHVRIRDIIREAPYFTRQTRPVVRGSDVPQEIITKGQQRTTAMLREIMGENASEDQLRAYQVLTGLSSHSFSAMRDLLGMPKAVSYAKQHGGETVMVLFDYGHFTALYEAVISDIAEFDAGIEVLTQTERYHVTYDTPYIRNLPTQLSITRSTDEQTTKEVIGPSYEDPFRIELDAFYKAIVDGEFYETTLTDAANDLALFADVGAKFTDVS